MKIARVFPRRTNNRPLFNGALTREERDQAHMRFLRDAERLVTDKALLADLLRERQREERREPEEHRYEQLTIGAVL